MSLSRKAGFGLAGRVPPLCAVVVFRLWCVFLPFFSFLCAFEPGAASAASVTLAWDAPADASKVAGYRLHYGTASRQYPNVINVGNRTSSQVTGLVEGATYYFAASSYDLQGNSSAFSNEVRYTVPLSTPTVSLTVNAGPDLAVDQGQVTVLNGTATPTSGASVSSYRWSQVSGPAVALSNAAAAQCWFTAPDVDFQAASLVFLLTVTDTAGRQAGDTCTVTVNGDGGVVSGSNVLSNWGFESGTDGWNFFTSGQGTYGVESPGFEGSRAARVSVALPGTNTQLFQSGIHLEPDTDYQLSFAATVNSGRDLKVSLQKHGAPYTNYGLSLQAVNLGTNWALHKLAFKTKNFSEPVDDARLMFWFADTALAGDTFWIDCVSLSKATSDVTGTTPPPAAPQTNLVGNPGFEEGTGKWNFFTNGGGTLGTVSPGLDSATAGRIAITAAGTNTQLYQYGIALEPNTSYQLSFSAYSISGRDLKVSLLKHGAPFTDYGVSMQTIDLGTRWAVHSIAFKTKNFTGPVSDARLMFWFADLALAGDQFFVDNVVLVKQ
ncbi:MAG: hypothetical protein GX443_00295 [Deltaproteobacteria bacterium]|nr:hypothetical protein [Deltaproteobacteria bacterium]